VRESLELSLVAALQHLPPQQRAVLIIRQVLGFSALETAELLDTTVPAVNSALQRARATTATLLPDRSQGRTLAALGDDRVRDLAGRYADAIERSDIDGLCAMLTEDATWSMPPDPEWYRGLPDIADFHIESVAPERWRHWPARANGQLAVGGYMYDPGLDSYVATVLGVLHPPGRPHRRGDRVLHHGAAAADGPRGDLVHRSGRVRPLRAPRDPARRERVSHPPSAPGPSSTRTERSKR
jgi:RNA polymerase sigma-70 factor (ECF subfamily)